VVNCSPEELEEDLKMPKKIIVDTICLIALENLDLFDLLPQLYEEVLTHPRLKKNLVTNCWILFR